MGFALVRWEEAHARGDWINLHGLLSLMYFILLAIYLISYALCWLIIKGQTGQSRPGPAYLLAIALTPILAGITFGYFYE